MSQVIDRETKRLGARLRALRIRHGLRQDDVAATMETDAGSVSRIESGKRDPSLRQLRRLARRYGTTAGALVDGADVDVHGRSMKPAAR